MADVPGGVPLGGHVSPLDDTDSYPITDPRWGLGALRTVADSTARDAISTARREEGMLVYVVSEDVYYKLNSPLTNSDWEVFSASALAIVSAIEPSLPEVGLIWVDIS